MDVRVALLFRKIAISLHNVRSHDSTREITKQGLEEFRKLLGRYPRVHANHSTNGDNIYWEPHVSTGCNFSTQLVRRCMTDILLNGTILPRPFFLGRPYVAAQWTMFEMLSFDKTTSIE